MRANDGIFSDGHSRHDRGLSPDLAVPLEHDRALFSVDGRYRINGAMRSNLNPGFNDYAELRIDVGECSNVRPVTKLQSSLMLDHPIILSRFAVLNDWRLPIWKPGIRSCHKIVFLHCP